MIGPVANPSSAAWRRAWRHRNIVHIVEPLHISGLELHGRHAAGRLEIREAEGTKARNRVKIFKNYYAVKEDTKSVVWRRARFHDLIEKAQIVQSSRCSGKGLADRVKIGTVRTEECAESIVGWRERRYAKVTAGRRRCGCPASEGAGLEIAVNNEVAGSWSGSGDQQNADGGEKTWLSIFS